MHKQRKLTALRQALGHETLTKGEEVVFFCPKHPARAGRSVGQLSVNVEAGWFNCWSCGFKGRNLVPLLPRNSEERRELIAEIQEETGLLRKVEPQQKKYDTPALPNEFKTLSRPDRSPYYRAAMAYLAERGIGRSDILRWKLGYCEDGEYKNRIVIPSFDEYGHLNFVTARSIYDNPQKYKNGNFDKDIIFNDYLIDWDRPIVVTEGPFDAFKAGENAIALQGSILNSRSKLFSKIVLSGAEVYFAMDDDAFKKQLAIIGNLVSYGVTCQYVGLGGKKDVGEMTKEEFSVAKSRAVPVRTEADLLRLRILA